MAIITLEEFKQGTVKLTPAQYQEIAEAAKKELERIQHNNHRAIAINERISRGQRDYEEAAKNARDQFNTDSISELSKLVKTRTEENLFNIEATRKKEDLREKAMDDMDALFLGMG